MAGFLRFLFGRGAIRRGRDEFTLMLMADLGIRS